MMYDVIFQVWEGHLLAERSGLGRGYPTPDHQQAHHGEGGGEAQDVRQQDPVVQRKHQHSNLSWSS